ncbi:MAG: hypothetical protein D6714_03625 [Bacteroidetes bacterium]|nr:MAG: hypothetical protein D6714_03625 [Bacteroidota bacterium]
MPVLHFDDPQNAAVVPAECLSEILDFHIPNLFTTTKVAMKEALPTIISNADGGVLREVNQALVALDLTATDADIIRYLSFIGRYLPIKSYHFLHVVPYFEPTDPFFLQNVEALEKIWERNDLIVQEMDSEVSEAFADYDSIMHQYEVAAGNPLSELLKAAEAYESDLVVIGTKREDSGFGILARNLIRKVKSSALVVPQQVETKLETILVPIDFSGFSANALETAATLGSRMKKAPKLVCVHVFELPSLSVYASGTDRAKFAGAMEVQAREAMDIFLEKFAADYPGEIMTHIIDQEGGPVAPYLFDVAKMEHADLIVMGAKGHSPVERLFIGSVTERMLNINKDIPTLVIKSE